MIKIIANKDTKQFVTMSKNTDKENPKGYFQVQEETVDYDANGWEFTVTKSMLMKGLYHKLQERVVELDYKMKGCLYIEELVESDLDNRPDLKKRVLSKELREIPISQFNDEDLEAYEKAIKGSLKLSGKNGIQLTFNGKRILRFTSYDPTGTKTDTLVAYNNYAEMNEYQKANPRVIATTPETEAVLPAGDEPVDPKAKATK